MFYGSYIAAELIGKKSYRHSKKRWVDCESSLPSLQNLTLPREKKPYTKPNRSTLHLYSIATLMIVTDKMKAVTTRIPIEEQEWLEEVEKESGAQRSEVLRRLIEKGLNEWRKERALSLLRGHKITVRKAAEIAGVTYVEMLELASQEGIDIGYDLKELERDLERI